MRLLRLPPRLLFLTSKTFRDDKFTVAFVQRTSIFTGMNQRTISSWLAAVIVAASSWSAFAEQKENPYQIIIDRNPFGLRPIPPPPPPPDNTPPPPPPLEIKLTGITTLLGPAKVFLEFTDPQPKNAANKTEFQTMSEGDVYKEFTVVSIDAENNRVKIKNGDAETWLDFEKNGKKATGAAAVPGTPPPPAFAGIPAAPAIPPAPVGGVSTPAATARGGLVGGSTVASAAPVPQAGYNGAVPGSTVLGSSPARPLRTDSGAGLVGGYGVQPTAPAGTGQTPAQPAMTREQLIQHLQNQRALAEQQKNGTAAIIPPPPIPAPLPAK
jgi:hypothetical protein